MVPSSHGFYEYLPQGYNSESQSYPLLVFLHGVGEVGDGNAGSLPTVLRNGPPKVINEGNFPTSFYVNGQTYKFIVISPQFNSWPSPTDVQGVIDYAVKNYRVNKNKIYVSGVSMGGGATWEYAGYSADYANQVAAILPVCGASGPDLGRAGTIAAANLPVWGLHNDGDPTVPVAFTNTYVDWINSFNPNPRAKKTIFANANYHDAWSVSFDPNYRENNLNVYEWMLQYDRGTIASARPVDGSSIPGRIEAENYSAMYGIQTSDCWDAGGGLYVGSLDNGDWMDYTVNVATEGNYTVSFRVASIIGGQQFQLKKTDGTVLSTNYVPQTGNYQIFTTITSTVYLAAGAQTLRIGSLQSGWNLNWIDFASGSSSSNAIPGRIEAEAYSNMSGILTANAFDVSGDKYVGWIDSGDWMDYNVNVSSAGTYLVNFRVATPYSTSQFQLKKSDGTTLATVSVPQTNNWQYWTTISATVQLGAGNQTLRISSLQTGWNINWIEFVPFTNPLIPGKIQAENYNAMSGIKTDAVFDDGGGLYVGWIEVSDWMDYTVNVTSAGNYAVNFRLASPYSNGQFQIRTSDGTVLSTVSVPQTWGFQYWSTVSTTIPLQAGNQTLRIYSMQSGWNINWFEFVYSSALNSVASQGPVTTSIGGADIAKSVAQAIVKLYPNPVKDQFLLEVNNDHMGLMNVQIVDQYGSVRKEYKISKNQTYTQMTIPLSALSAGTYFLKIQIGEWKDSKKLVKL